MIRSSAESTAGVFRWLLIIGVSVGASCRKADQTTQPAQTPRVITTTSGIEMVLIPAGRFAMGGDSGQPDEQPVHEIHIDALLMDRHEMTQEHYTQLHRRYLDIFLPRAAARIQVQDWAGAEAAYQRILQDMPDDRSSLKNWEAKYGLGRALLGLGKPAEALKPLMDASHVKPGEAGICYCIAQCYVKQKKGEDAIEALKDTLKANEKDTQARRLLAELHYETQQWTPARAEFERVAGEMPDVAPKLGRTCIELGAVPDAIQWLRKAVEHDDGDFESKVLLVQLLAEHPQDDESWPEAVKLGESVIPLADKIAEKDRPRVLGLAHNFVGLARYRLGNWDAGIQDCVKGTALWPKLLDGHPLLNVSTK